MRVLIIDDNEQLRSGIAEMLEIKGHEALVAANGQLGIEIAIQSLPDIIFCDMQMPVMDGYETLHELRKNPKTANIPFIILTGTALSGEMKKFEEAGVDAWLNKPFSNADLFAIIDSYRP